MFSKAITLKISLIMSQKVVYLVLGFFVLLCFVLLFAVFRQQSTIADLQKGSTVVVAPTTTDERSFPVTDYRNEGQSQSHTQPTMPVQKPATAQAVSPEQTVDAFYSYFFSRPNPLANGAYKTNSYLSDSFKADISTLYDNGNKPVFCPQNKRPTIIIGKSQQVYNTYGYITQLVITDAGSGNKDLYRVLVKNQDGLWVIDDINCIR
jgi:hypothetical protein